MKRLFLIASIMMLAAGAYAQNKVGRADRSVVRIQEIRT